jgi:predicted transcriptional regulator
LDTMLTTDNSDRDKKSNGSLFRGESNFSRYVEVYRKLLLLNEENNLATTLKNIQELLSFSEKIFSSPAVAEAFLYFCLHGAATAWVLQNELNQPEATTYRALKRMRSLGIVVPALKISKVKSSKGGPRPTVWSLERASTDEISKALKLHYQMLSPKFRVAEDVAQTILDEYIDKRKVLEITYKEIVIQVKELKIPFRTPDIADLAANYLNEKGIKVWR